MGKIKKVSTDDYSMKCGHKVLCHRSAGDMEALKALQDGGNKMQLLCSHCSERSGQWLAGHEEKTGH
jgi:hypothetical protein